MRIIFSLFFILFIQFPSISLSSETVSEGATNAEHKKTAETPDSGSTAETLDTPSVNLPQPGTNAESFNFSADVSKILDILIHSLYSNKEIFLRELISNASDALDKLRQLILASLVKDKDIKTEDFKIRIIPDKEHSTLSIIDNGIGMTKEEMKENLGTIARSGTASFLKALESGKDSSLIGQFGVGFYSVYLVSDSVVVTSKSPESDKQYKWISNADTSFYVEEDLDGERLERGTKVTLYLKEDAKSYLDSKELSKILGFHSQFISYPIYLQVEKEREVEETQQEGDDDDLEPEGSGEDEQGKEDDQEEEEEEEEKEKKTKKEMYKEEELVNALKPLWVRPTSEITEEEYFEFYKVHAKATQNPQAYIHFSAEGEIEFKSILFVPGSASSDPYADYGRKEGVISLYVKRVLITNEFKDLLPQYLGFIRGVVDSESLPLNVNREVLQQSRIMSVIGKKLTRKAISMFQTLSNKHKKGEDAEASKEEEKPEETQTEEDNEDYKKFYKNFGRFLKVGVTEDKTNRNRLAKLLRFPSTLHPQNMTSLQGYVSRMKEGQKFIYYLAGENIESLQNHPTIERLTDLGYEIILLADSLDEHCLQSLGEFEGMKIADTSRETMKVDEEESEKKRVKVIKKMYDPLTKWYSKLLGSDVEKVVISKRLVSSPAAVVVGDFGWTANMERVMKSQIFSSTETYGYMKPKKTFELNPGHPIIRNLLERVNALPQDEDKDSGEQKLTEEAESLSNHAKLLYQSTLINSGFSLPPSESASFMSTMDILLRQGLSISQDEKVEEVEVEIPEEESEEKESPEDFQNGDPSALPEDFELLKDLEKGKDEL